MLAIALVPSLAVIGVGGSAAASSIADSRRAQQWSGEVLRALPQTKVLVPALQEERLFSVAFLAGNSDVSDSLTAARSSVDAALLALVAETSELRTMDAQMGQGMVGFDNLATKLPLMRAGTDTRGVGVGEAYDFYSGLMETIADTGRTAQTSSPDPKAGIQIAGCVRLLFAIEGLSRSNALAFALQTGDGKTEISLREFAYQEGFYRTEVESLRLNANDDQRRRIEELVGSAAWVRLGQMEEQIGFQAARQSEVIAGSTRDPRPAPQWSVAEHQQAAEEVSNRLLELWIDENYRAQHLAEVNSTAAMRNSQLLAAAVAGISVFAIVVSLLLANQTISRLRRLRRQSMDLADRHLPELMSDLAAGNRVDVASAIPPLDFGTDEIGGVATAFDHAARTAIGAAVSEVHAREGVEAVFLNIARRSQVVVHRQLEILDNAERREENADFLATLFRLDHLVTRERRNAENLVILGGGEVGRRWRSPISLLDVVRSAVAETQDYDRVQVSRLPAINVVGAAVADVMHLLAELVDNATSFSPPQSSVEIKANEVGRGVVVEVDDRGLGMTPKQLAQANSVLASPEAFDVAALVSDSRLGLYVISRLAARHGISVKLVESDHGGVRAIVLIPSVVLVGPVTALPAKREEAGDQPTTGR
ncbi:nitrate- and nitrite sensing domain-containing protein [Nocardia sp. NPDC050697]|uniref:sensor histidine kinase n=1 Tax=Nocardia sp. NPDC050697 TaxID=3155158 RepID=UPI0033CBE245